MHQILFHIPTPWGNIPIFGYGVMLFLAFLVGGLVAARRAKAEGIDPGIIWDVGFYCFLGGVVGARLLFMILFPEPGNAFEQVLHFVEIWKGGMVFYGGLAGGFLAYVLAWRRIVRPAKLSTFKIADIVAPSLALGVFFGRLGCFLNGCCYGDFADPMLAPFGVQFPGNSPPLREFVGQGYQTAFGFLLSGDPKEPRKVVRVEKFSGASEAGLGTGDIIVKVGDVAVPTGEALIQQMSQWPQGEPVPITVERSADGKTTTHELRLELPQSLPVQPTQLYNALDGLLLFLLLIAFYPLHRREGQVMALFLICYPINRFIMEALRLDNPPTFTGLTLSQNISILAFVAGGVLMAWVTLRGAPRSVPPAATTLAGPGDVQKKRL
jgi:phosphatidylglycerol:prolipoprotein diacylglycerol transferase